MTHGPWKGPSNISTTGISTVTTEGDSWSAVKSAVKLPPVMAVMDRAEALAFVSRLYDSAQAGARIWSDALLIKRFLTHSSRTGSQETRDGYRREVRRFMRWRDRNHPDLHLREIDPSLAEGGSVPPTISPQATHWVVCGRVQLFVAIPEVSHCPFLGIPSPLPPR